MRKSRRQFLRGVAQAGMATSGVLTTMRGAGGGLLRGAQPGEQSADTFHPRAEHCIQLWLGGGASQIDTWDPKRVGDGEKVAGSQYESIPSAIPDASVCKHLGRTAPILDRAVLVRSVHHDLHREHGAATNRMHTGRPTSGTVVYPSMGSVVTHELGAAAPGVPPYVVIGYPNLTRGPGFLGPQHGFIYLTDTNIGPPALRRPASITPARERRRQALLENFTASQAKRRSRDRAVEEYWAMSREASRLRGPQFMDAFQLEREPGSLRESYGSEFGQRCLLARRLIQRGVRFIEIAHNLNFINGTGWDTHNEGQQRQHGLIEEMDKAFSTLVLDLERHGLLEKTLIIISTEFGRPAKFDSRGGRGHQSKAFSVVLAGGGLRGGQVVGETDELSENIVKQPVSVPDLFATVYKTLGVDHRKELYAGNRPVPITDRGEPIPQLF
jgi:hypothetical protein